MKIATWNINSVRLRIDLAIRFLKEERPDILCLQEIKCRTDQFPARAFTAAGYPHHAVSGQSGYHGVAIVARAPLAEVKVLQFCGKDDARHISATVAGGVRVHNVYAPAGGDVPDPAANEKFEHKLRFLSEMERSLAPKSYKRPEMLVGDLNVAPREHDVWSHRQMKNVVSHTAAEVELLDRAAAAGWEDVARALIPEPEKLYTWWSYRAADWRASNRGRRLDHIWVSEPLADQVVSGGRGAFAIHDRCRGWERPSDHAPVTLTIDV